MAPPPAAAWTSGGSCSSLDVGKLAQRLDGRIAEERILTACGAAERGSEGFTHGERDYDFGSCGE
jgi:hypothetical protein